jgi:hypothetical protein
MLAKVPYSLHSAAALFILKEYLRVLLSQPHSTDTLFA